MQILRGLGHTVRMLLTAGNLVGATPPFLSPDQRLAFRAQTRSGFGSALAYALQNDAELVLIAGGLLATAQPPLDDLRFVTQWMQRLRDAGVPVVALDDWADPARPAEATGLAFLADLDLVFPLRPVASDAFAMDVGGLRIGFTADPAFEMTAEARELLSLLVLLTDDPQAAERAPADLTVIGDVREPAQAQRGSVVVVRPGWTAPSLDAQDEAGFTWLELDGQGIRQAEFLRLAGATPEQVRIRADEVDARDPAAALAARIEPMLGQVPLARLEFEGQFSREVWHRCRVGELVHRAARAGTVLAVDASGLDLGGHGTPSQARSSFSVELRRAADRLARETAPDEADLVREARTASAAAFRRQEPVELLP